MTNKFIKLTENLQDGKKQRTILVNVRYLASVKIGDRQMDTHVCLHDGKYFFVKESVEQIELLINTDTSLAPVIMTAEEALKYYQAKGVAG